MSLGPYGSYKDSGVRWFIRVPDHWKCAAFKWEIVANDGGVWGDEPDGEEDTIVLRSTEQTIDGHWRLDDPAARKLTSGDRSAALLLAGDLLLTKSSGSSLHIGKTTLVTEEIAALGCCYSNFMQRVRMGAAYLPKLAWYLLNSDIARPQFGFLSNSTTGLANINGTIIGEIVVPVAPPFEQAAIVAFLDRETAKIDALVEEQRRLIELLKEKRQAVISHAVTKGLNPSAPMKDSGVEWLGEVPAHWEVKQLKRVATVLPGFAFSANGFSNDPGHTRLLRGVNIAVGSIRWDDNIYWDRGTDDGLDKFELRPGDLVLGMDRPWIGDGLRVAIIREIDVPCLLLQRVAAIKPRSQNSCRFLRLLLELPAFFHHCTPDMTGVSVPHISGSQVEEYVIANPPEADQPCIADYVEAQTRTFDELVTTAEAAITLLQERRAALISAAVTGKIDVRGWTDADVRRAVTAEIIYLNARDRTFGRVKNQKLIYLAQVHAGIHEIGGRYERHAAGPYDGALMAVVERELEGAGVVTVRQDIRGSAVDYVLTPGWKPDRERLKTMLGDRLAAFDHVNEKFADLDTRQAEAVATLYAVWNDVLIDGEACDDSRVIRGSLDEWHPEKREKFKAADLREWLGWMRRNGLVPEGRGPKTAAESLFKTH